MLRARNKSRSHWKGLVKLGSVDKTKGSFEDPDLELLSDFGSLQEWDPLSGPRDRPLCDIPRTQPGRRAHLRISGFSRLWRRADSKPVPLTEVSRENTERREQWVGCWGLCVQRAAPS
ncbi:LYR motif-containing protein 9 isoform X4 [Hypanus sabinus]|uniref:LYR motif-containing protein 9 isoform X4 n=1 Tax=Hypanus sabinus TaxID=79690 RepID=UPI0028C37B15|nr:LYR motif-containing protein 9 isoform X4 [Hypanus sabinus]